MVSLADSRVDFLADAVEKSHAATARPAWVDQDTFCRIPGSHADQRDAECLITFIGAAEFLWSEVIHRNSIVAALERVSIDLPTRHPCDKLAFLLPTSELVPLIRLKVNRPQKVQEIYKKYNSQRIHNTADSDTALWLCLGWNRG